MLGVLDERQLAHAMFPLGDTLTTKDEIRAEAERRGLAVAKKPDSHDICFIADGDTQGFLAKRLGSAERRHRRRGRRPASARTTAPTASPSASARACASAPRPPTASRATSWTSRPVDNTVTVGPAEALDVTALTAIRPRWCGTAAGRPRRYTAQLRAHGDETCR